MKENSKYIVNRAYNKLLPPTMLSFSIASIAAITDIFFVSFYCGSFGFAVYSIFLPFSSIWGVIGEGYGTSGSSFLSKFIGGNNIRSEERRVGKECRL